VRLRRLAAVFKDHDVVAVEVRMKLLDPVEVHNDRPVNANKLRRVEPLFQIIHLFPQQMRLAANMQLRIIPVRFNEIDLVNLQQHHPA
jgi:hypothetical protein